MTLEKHVTSSLNPKTKEKKLLRLGEPFRKINVGVKHFEGRDEHRTSSLCGVSTFLNKLSPAQHAYLKKSEHTFTNCKVKIIAYADSDCCFKGRGPGVSLADGRMQCWTAF